MTEGITVVALDPSLWSLHPPKLAEGVLGYAHVFEGDLWIMLLIGDPPGEGHVGRYLDSLIQDQTHVVECDRMELRVQGRIIVVESLNKVLQGMLERRGFEPVRTVMPPPINDVVDVMAYG